ncbi:hypothetical protein ACH4LN_32725 [Streptomyces albus]|uniref:hypothetical protein n=1 Tax=Streptomyces TaxID=1883 RepID=UPI00034E240C|nr:MULTISPECIES: hypothetical protein [Streptomyces]EPD95531.1 hypothetical protein HMPREF1486_01728 [Streptomyces sp. HPH0547]GHJ23804.1 hypothetical protein TPA0909_54180 [Streptomyces albus]
MDAVQKGITRHERGAYRADESTAQQAPPEPPWVGRVLREHRDGTVQLITPTGYAWTAAPGDMRSATEEERAAYDAQVRAIQRERDALYRQLRGGARS